MENNIVEPELQINLEGEPKPEEGGETTPTNDELTPEQIADLKKKASVSSQNFERAKKLEEELKKLKAEKKPEPKVDNEVPTLTPKDTIALIEAKVSTDDFDTVVDWAKFKKVSVADALKDKILQVSLREKNEERQTASLTTIKGKGGFKKESPEEIVARASKGELPEDDAGIARLAEAHHQIKMRGIK